MSDLSPAALSGWPTTTASSRPHLRRRRRRPQDPAAASRRRRAPAPTTRASSSSPRRAPRLEQRCAALCAAHPVGVRDRPHRRVAPRAATHADRVSAALLDPPRRPRAAAKPGVRFRQTTALRADRSARARPDGIIVASWARLAFDLAADLRPLDHLSVLNQLLHERQVTAERARRHRPPAGHPARRGHGDVPPHPQPPRRRAARVPSRGRARRCAAPTQRPGRAPARVAQLPDGRTVAHRPRRTERPLGRRARHPSRAPHARRRCPRRPAHTPGAPGRRGRSSPSPRSTWQDVEHLADELATLYHVRRRAVAGRSEGFVSRPRSRKPSGAGKPRLGQMVGTSVWRPKTSARARMTSPRVA